MPHSRGLRGDQVEQKQTHNRLLKLPSVLDRVAISKSEIYAKIKNGDFPAPIKLSSRSVAWSEKSIDEWIASLIQAQGESK
jgi:prophage regulatory protein